MTPHDKHKFLMSVDVYKNIEIVDFRNGRFGAKYESDEQRLGQQIENFMVNQIYDRLNKDFDLAINKAISFNIPGENSNRVYELDMIAYSDTIPKIIFEIKASRNWHSYSYGWKKLMKLSQIARMCWPNIKCCYLFTDTGVLSKTKHRYFSNYNDFSVIDFINLAEPDNKFIFKYE